MKNTQYTHRFVAQIMIECATPMALHSGEKDILTDALVATDINGMPYIPGTSIAGIIRHAIGEDTAKKYLGYHEDNSIGSKVIFSEGKLVGPDGGVLDGHAIIDPNNAFYALYHQLPIRQHVKINDKGCAKDGGKFDEQVVFKGSRFVFEVEMVGTDEKEYEGFFKTLLNTFSMGTLRVGGGTRKGFGEIKIISCTSEKYDLTKEEQLNKYLSKSSCLSVKLAGEEIEGSNSKRDSREYRLTLTPEDFFLMGSGYGDSDVDMSFVSEPIIVWNGNKASIKEECTLIPASSIKGALAHRTAYHFNRILERYADNSENLPRFENENEAVQALFGYESQSEKSQLRGALLFSDIIDEPVQSKILNHVSIDRLTGGAIDGALFSEKVQYADGREFKTTIYLSNGDFEYNLKELELEDKKDKILEAFECALKDLCEGYLPLGGGVNRGHGRFIGKYESN